jgi:hypothetical protein
MARRLALPLLLALLVLAVSGTSAFAGDDKAIWGPVRLPGGATAFDVYEDLGVSTYQYALNWARIAPNRPANPTAPDDPAYAWPTELDEAVAAARARRIQVALLVNFAPGWANGGRQPRWVPRSADYADFLTAASRRYPTVRRWMIWGETNRAAVFQPLPPNSPVGPRRYARLLAAAYAALKRQSRRNVVIGGMTFSFGEVRPRDFVRWMRLPDGRPAPLDLYGHNPFTRRFPNLADHGYAGYPGARDIGDVDTFARELRRLYRGRYPGFRTRGPRLWLSEFTVSSDRANRSFDFFVSRREQARWLRAAYAIARRSPFVAGLGWWNLIDEPRWLPGGGQTTGLLTSTGERKPAYDAYRDAR